MDKSKDSNGEGKEQYMGKYTMYVKFINQVTNFFILLLRCSPLKKIKSLALEGRNEELMLATFCLDLVMAL